MIFEASFIKKDFHKKMVTLSIIKFDFSVIIMNFSVII